MDVGEKALNFCLRVLLTIMGKKNYERRYVTFITLLDPLLNTHMQRFDNNGKKNYERYYVKEQARASRKLHVIEMQM